MVELPEVAIDEEIHSEGEPDTLGDEETVHYIDREKILVVETIYE